MSYQVIKLSKDDLSLDNFVNNSLSSSTASTESLSESEYLHQYCEYLSTEQQLPSDKQINQIFLRKGVYECSTRQNAVSLLDNNELSYFHIQRQISINNSQMVVFQVHIGTFQLRVSLLNTKGDNPLLKYLYAKCGIYGKIYFAPFLSETTAIKVFSFDKDNDQQKTIIVKAIKEYSIMKICSIIECGPFLNNTFGFDLIAFDDSVMFTMQKCQELKAVNQSIIQSLKYGLRYLHRCQIIHFDIKPENILWSHKYQKPVFIDFGFSQNIRAKVGQKTMLSFRGSPAYCGEQMIKLLGNSQSHRKIDAYFNDAVGLMISIGRLQYEASLNITKDLKATNGQIIQGMQIQYIFLVYLLKYKFLAGEKQGIVELLSYKKSILFQKYGNDVFKIFQKTLSTELFEYIYSKFEKEFERFIQPSIIHSFFNQNYKIFSPRHHKESEEELKNDAFNKKMSVTGKELYGFQNQFQKYKQFLSLEKVYIDPRYQEELRHILIQCLRFDCKNNTLDQKTKWAKIFNKANGLVQDSSSLGPIKNVFQNMLEFCLSKPATKWKRSHIFVVIHQSIMLDINIENYMDSIFEAINQNKATFHEKIKCFVQLSKISYLQAFKYKSDHIYMKKNVPSMILQLGRRIFQQILNDYQTSCETQIRYIVRALNQSLRYKPEQQKTKGNKNVSDLLLKLPQSAFTNELTEFLFLERLNRCQFDKKMQPSCQIMSEIKQYKFYKQFKEKSQIFHHSAYQIVRILIYFKNYKQLIQFLENIKDSINCPEICDRYTFQMTIFLFGNQTDTKSLLKYSNEIINSTSHFSFQQTNSIFSQLMLKIWNNKQFQRSYPEVTDKFIQTLSFIDNKLMPNEQVLHIEEIEKIMYKYNIASFMLQTNPKFKAQIFGKLLNSLAIIIQNRSIIKEEQLAYYKFHLYIYQSAYQLATKKYQEMLISFEKLYQISKQLRIRKAQDYFLKKIIFTAILASNNEKLNKYTYLQYHFSEKILSCSPYFQANQKSLITITLYQFELNGDLKNFYQFLMTLATYVTKNPYQSNFKIWSEGIQKLMKLQKYRNLMTFRTLSLLVGKYYWNKRYFVWYFLYSLQIEQNDQAKRRILVKIAQNIQFLNNYAKDIIMKKNAYFIISFYSTNKRKMLSTLFKWRFKYLNKSCFNSIMERFTKGRNNIRSNNQKIAKIKQKIKRGFQN